MMLRDNFSYINDTFYKQILTRYKIQTLLLSVHRMCYLHTSRLLRKTVLRTTARRSHYIIQKGHAKRNKMDAFLEKGIIGLHTTIAYQHFLLALTAYVQAPSYGCLFSLLLISLSFL